MLRAACLGSFLIASSSFANDAILELQGLGAEDRFGSSVTGDFDFDGDGVLDVMVGAPGIPKSPAGTGGTVGYVQVLSGVDGSILFQQTGQIGAEFGHAVSVLGDISLSGFVTLAVGEPSYTPPNPGGFGERKGRVSLFATPSGNLLYSTEGAAAGDQFGTAITAADLTGNGLIDFVVGSPGSDAEGVDSGEFSVHFGLSGVTIGTTSVPGTAGYRAGTAFAITFGFTPFSALPDVAVGAPNPAGVGEVRIHKADLSLVTTFTGGSFGGLYGASLASASLSGNGAWSLAVGAPSSSTALATENGLVEIIRPAPQPTIIVPGSADGERFGAALSFIDAEGNGVQHLMVAAAGAGTVEILPIIPALATPIRKFFGGAGTPSCAPIGDVNQDGSIDLAIGWSDGGGTAGVASGVVEVHHADPDADDTVVEVAASCPFATTPRIDVLGCPAPGETIEITLVTGLGSNDVALLVGTGNASIPVFPGCSLHIGPLTPAILVIPNAPGTLTLPTAVPSFMPTTDAWMQAMVLNPGLPFDLRLSNAIRVKLQ